MTECSGNPTADHRLGFGARAGSKRMSRRPVRLKLGLAVLLAALTSQASAGPVSLPLVETNKGQVQGILVDGVAKFLGIPYAAPPVWDLRWKAPVEHARWSGVRRATDYGPICAQEAIEPFSGPTNTNEDCLYLNIFTSVFGRPGKDTRPDKLPVMLFIHGGGSLKGHSNGYDGSKLASKGRTVVVTINYRLNAFGFLAHPALQAGGSLGNYGLLDQQFALAWVKRNIAKFGGDPDNITIFGESGGAHDVNAHLLSPLSAGLFQRAIQQSGAPATLIPSQIASKHGIAFSLAVGCGPGSDAVTARCLRSLPASKILENSALLGTSATPLVGDGRVLPPVAETAFETGNFNHVPIMNGSNENEFNWMMGIIQYNRKSREPYSEQEFVGFLKSRFAGNAGPGGAPPAYPPGTIDKILAQYPLKAYPSVQSWADAAGTDGVFQIGACKVRHFTRLVADQVPVYQYEFRDQTAVSYFPDMPGFTPQAYHTAELMYLFPGWHGHEGTPRTFNAEEQALSDRLIAAWSNFAWYGNPNGAGNQPWPRYSSDSPVIFSFDVKPAGLTVISDDEFSTRHKCDFWDGILVYKPE
jgi:para-nitrobenzyl esterase